MQIPLLSFKNETEFWNAVGVFPNKRGWRFLARFVPGTIDAPPAEGVAIASDGCHILLRHADSHVSVRHASNFVPVRNNVSLVVTSRSASRSSKAQDIIERYC